MLEFYKLIGFLFIISLIQSSCTYDPSIPDSIWYSSDIETNHYEELILINQDSNLMVYPITLDGIKPSKKLILEGKYIYKISGENKYKFEIKNHLIRIIGQNETIPFLKYRNYFDDAENFELVLDSFIFRRNNALGDSINFSKTNR